MTKAARTGIRAVVLTCQPGGMLAGCATPSPIGGSVVCPSIPIAAQARQEAIVKPTTQGFRRRRASEIAPSAGIAMTIRIEATALAVAYTRSVEPRSLTTQ